MTPGVFDSNPPPCACRRSPLPTRPAKSGSGRAAFAGVAIYRIPAAFRPPCACRRAPLPTRHREKAARVEPLSPGVRSFAFSPPSCGRLYFCSPFAVFRRVTISASRRNADPAFSHPLRDISPRSGGGRGFPASGSPTSPGRRRPAFSILTRRLSLAAERSSSLAPAKKRLGGAAIAGFAIYRIPAAFRPPFACRRAPLAQSPPAKKRLGESRFRRGCTRSHSRRRAAVAGRLRRASFAHSPQPQ